LCLKCSRNYRLVAFLLLNASIKGKRPLLIASESLPSGSLPKESQPSGSQEPHLPTASTSRQLGTILPRSRIGLWCRYTFGASLRLAIFHATAKKVHASGFGWLCSADVIVGRREQISNIYFILAVQNTYWECLCRLPRLSQ